MSRIVDSFMRSPRVLIAVLLFGLAGSAASPLGAARLFQRGDSNGDARLDLSDPVHTFGFLFHGSPVVHPCLDAADSNDDGRVDISDPLRTLGYLFHGAPQLPPPFRECGEDPTADEIGCGGTPSCATPAGFLFPNRVYDTGEDPYSIALLDLDGDGDADLAVANAGSDTLSVLRNQGNEFAAQVQYGVGSGPASVALGDFDGDGDADLAVVSSSRTVSILLNQNIP